MAFEFLDTVGNALERFLAPASRMARNSLEDFFPSKTYYFGEAQPPQIDVPQDSGGSIRDKFPSRTYKFGSAADMPPPQIQYGPNQIQGPAQPPTFTPSPAAEPYAELINSSAQQYGLPADVFYRQLARESMGFDPRVISGEITSPVGAQGVGQFMPETADWWANSYGQFDPNDPQEAIPAAAAYMQYLQNQFGGELPLALAAYNAGPGNVRQYGGVPPFDETKAYLEAILNGER